MDGTDPMLGQKYAAYFDGYLKELGITGATTNRVFAPAPSFPACL